MEQVKSEEIELGFMSSRHICIECGKEFKSGKALGGHKRIHGIDQTRKLIRPKMILPNGFIRDEFGKIEEVSCNLCDKKFSSRKALYGHMRFHPERSWRGLLPPSIPSSLSSSLSSDFDDDDDDDDNDDDDDDDDDDNDDEQSELCDNMKFEHVLDLKETIRSWNVTGKRGRKSLLRAELNPVLEVEEEAMNNGASNLLNFAYGGEAKLDLTMEEKSDNIIKKKKKRKLFELKEKDEEQLDASASASTTTTTPAGACDKHVCVTCNKSFTSYQALGGHRASHNKVKLEFQGRVSGQEACGLLGNEVTGQGTGTATPSVSNSNNNNGEHICNICHKSFPTGQALGGHKRCHWTGPVISSEATTTAAAIAAASSSQGVQKMKELEKTLLSFDLNELPPNEERG